MISGSWRSRAARITSAAWPLAGPDAPWLARSARRLLVLLPLSAVLLAGLLAPTPTSGSTLPQQPGTATAPGQPQATAGAAGERFFPETGFRLGDPATDPFADYFAARGGLLTFGYPSSRPFTLLGSRVQFFQRHVMQEQPGGVGLLNLLDEGFLAFTDFGNATIPPHDPALASAAPPPSTQDYGQEVSAFINLHVPNVWEGQPVGFLDAFLLPGILAGDTDPITQTLVGLEILGFPTSQPARDPENSSFIYQRFQRGVLHYNATTGLTQPLLLADYLKALMIGRGIPPALQAQATGSRFFLQYHPARPLWLTRPEQLPDTDLTAAFEPQEPLAGVQPFIATPPLPPPTTVPVIPIQPASTFGPAPTPMFVPPVPPTFVPQATPVSLQPSPSTTPTPLPEPPFVEGTEPGGVAVGQDIIIRGRHFGDQPGQVIFTGKLATAQVWSNTNIIVTVPQGAMDGTVRVRRPDGVISNAVGFAPATTPTPTETPTTPTPSLTPTVSPTASPSPTPTGFVIDSVESYYGPPGSTLTILGHGFQLTAGSVLVGNFAAPVTLWTDTTIVAQVPTQLSASQLPARVRVIRADGVTNTTINCFIVSPTDPTAVPPAPPTATPIPPSGC